MLSPSEGYCGIGVTQAYHYLDSLGLKPAKVLVAVIDGDLEVNHEDLKGRIWLNPHPGRQGYSNDIHGWNFLGGKDGRIVSKTGSEAFREYKRLRPKYEHIAAEQVKGKKEKKEYAYFLQMRREARINSYVQFGQYLKQIARAFGVVDSLVSVQGFEHEPRVADIDRIHLTDTALAKYYAVVSTSMLKYDSTTLWKEVYARQMEDSELAAKRIKSLDDPAGPRDKIGDRYTMKDKFYGNAVLADPDSFHGTFVAGIIGAARNNGVGMDGVADSVMLMGVRAIPDGDEYDKDVAMAIRYAVNNGAKIINMSFGKYISPDHPWVDDAVKYAASKGVLMVHAAGNDGRNTDSVTIYPSGMISSKRRSPYFIRVGASDALGQPARISNYGKSTVDVFAPGMRIYSTTPNGYTTADGTSLAAPVVSGLAALIWSYFPSLSAAELRDVLKNSVTTSPSFENKCNWGGIVNAYKAVKLAEQKVKLKK